MVTTSTAHLPASCSKHHHPYFSPAEVEYLSDKQRGKLSVSQEQKIKLYACGEAEAIGSRLGFPKRTIATAQTLYHRFHLFFPRKDFNYHDVVLAALYVATKMHDTLKKPQDLLLASYALRFPERALKSKNHNELENYVDTATHQLDRAKLLAIERLILEMICFNFTCRVPFPYVIKISRALNASKELTKFAWRLTVDCHRTLVPLQYPPHIVALGALYTASLLSSFEHSPQTPTPPPNTASAIEIAATLKKKGPWETQFGAQVQDLEEIAHAIIDLLILLAQNPSANTSPSTPQSPSPHHPAATTTRSQQHHASSASARHAHAVARRYKPDQLMRLKIAMRETEHPPRPRLPLGGAVGIDPEGASTLFGTGGEAADNEAAVIGQKEGTVRFLFGPSWVAGDGV